MERYCKHCGAASKPLHSHHIIPGRGKRKVCETPQSLIFLCVDCHALIHSSQGTQMLKRYKRELQKKYFSMGYTEDKVRQLMGGQLMLPEQELLRSKFAK
jgi:5-methylcytosine-specific restriction endonuclease McrA